MDASDRDVKQMARPAPERRHRKIGPMSDALVLLAHGSRDPQWARPVHAVADRLRSRHPELAVGTAFLEFAAPTFADSARALVEAGATRIRIAPVFLGQGGHLRRDVDALLQAARSVWPAVVFEVLAPMGEAPAVLDAIANWAGE